MRLSINISRASFILGHFHIIPFLGEPERWCAALAPVRNYFSCVSGRFAADTLDSLWSRSSPSRLLNEASASKRLLISFCLLGLQEIQSFEKAKEGKIELWAIISEATRREAVWSWKFNEWENLIDGKNPARTKWKHISARFLNIKKFSCLFLSF